MPSMALVRACVRAEKHFHERSAEPQVPPLRYAAVGMTKGRVHLPFAISCWCGETADPSAALGMTKGKVAVRERADRLFQSSLRDFSMVHANPGLRPGLS